MVIPALRAIMVKSGLDLFCYNHTTSVLITKERVAARETRPTFNLNPTRKNGGRNA